jgi:hypothetical protein
MEWNTILIGKHPLGIHVTCSKHRKNLKKRDTEASDVRDFEGMDSEQTNKLKYSLKCALETTMTGAFWTNERVHSIHQLVSPFCERCHVSVDSPFHSFWECPCNANIQAKALQNTQKYIPKAKESIGVEDCLFFRG